MLAANEPFKDYVLKQLFRMEGLHVTRMFRNYGLYHCGHFFGIVSDGKLFFRTDSITRSKYQAYGMKSYHGADRTMKRFYQVPPRVLARAKEAVRWAYEAASVKDTVRQVIGDFR